MLQCSWILSSLLLLLTTAIDLTLSVVQEDLKGSLTRRCPKIDVIRLEQNCEVNCNCPYNYDRVLRCDGECTHSDIVPDVLKRLSGSNASMLDLSIRKLPAFVTLGQFEGMRTPPSGLVVSTNGAMSGISPHAFQGLENSLITLSLVGNLLRSLPLALSSLTRLQTLDISKNALKSLKVKKKNGLGGLSSLDAESNNLKHVIFQTQMKNLKKLILRNNSLNSETLSYFMESVGIHCPIVEFINLEGNAIQGSLTPSHFPVQVESLHYLDFSGNMIAYILPGTFSNLPNLKSLNLQRNALDVIRPGTFIGLKKLNILDLSLNQIRVLHRENNELNALNSFDVSNNKLLFLNENFAIDGIKTLDLSNNSITSVTIDSLESLKNISVLSVKNNPLNCVCELHYFQSWLSKHESLNRQSRNSAICKTPHGFSGEELLSIIKLSSTCDNSNFDYLDEDEKKNDSSSSSPYSFNNGEDIQVSESDEGLVVVSVKKAKYKCDRISVFNTRFPDLEIYSKPVPPEDCLYGNGSFNINPESARIQIGKSYTICMTLRRPDFALVRHCSSPFSLKIDFSDIQIQSFKAGIVSKGVVYVDYNVSLNYYGDCGVWVLIKRETQTLTSRLLRCNSTEEIFSNLPVYPEYRVCYSLRLREFESADKMDTCTMALIKPHVLYFTSKSTILPLALTLIFLAVGCAALVVLYFIVKGYISDRRNASLFHRSGLKPPLSDFFECFKRATRTRTAHRGRSSSSSSALYLNGVDEESNNDDFEF
uniref:LRRCT domain-containing protein n=2 Tax=Lepeophtheirus salmonis TaxID=72036 RepID=A0A0K2T9V1_LEPSM